MYLAIFTAGSFVLLLSMVQKECGNQMKLLRTLSGLADPLPSRYRLRLALIFAGVILLLVIIPNAWCAEDLAPSSDQQLIHMSDILQKKESALQQKEELLHEKEQRLLVLQEELQKKERDIDVLRQRAEAILSEIRSLKDEDLTRLVEVYTAMKPEAAAPLVENLDLSYAVEVILRMEPRKAAKLLAAIEPRKATAISRSITALKGE